MAFDVKNLAMINLMIQIFLVILLSYAAFLAKKKDLRKHCMIIRIAVLLQIAAIGAIMLPSLLGYIELVHRVYYSILRYFFTTPWEYW